MRQSIAPFLLLFAVSALSGQTPAASVRSAEDQDFADALRQMQTIGDLVRTGALPRTKLDECAIDLADAQDALILRQTLYGTVSVQELTIEQADEMTAAAERRLEREKVRMSDARKLVDDGVAAANTLEPFQYALWAREGAVSLAHSQAQLFRELVTEARMEVDLESAPIGSLAAGTVERFDGSHVFLPHDLLTIETAFEHKFDRRLPISAQGETAVHRAMGFDHRGRVDVALNPDAREGIWLRSFLKLKRIPYFAFRHAVRGKATAAHIHIGPGSSRLTARAD